MTKRIRAFAMVAVVLLALGVGATTAMFSVINGVLLRPLAVPDPAGLVLVGESIPQQPAQSAKFAYFVNPVAYRAWRDQTNAFRGLALVAPSSFIVSSGGRPLLLHGAHVTPNFFSVMGIKPVLGRDLASSDTGDPSRPMVLSDSVWRSAFNADPGIIGHTVGVPGRWARIVGVLPPSFPSAGRAFGPMLEGVPAQFFDAALDAKDIATQNDVFSDFNFTVVARLGPGVSLMQAQAQLQVVDTNLARTAPDGLGLAPLVTTMQDYLVSTSRSELWLLQAGVLAVLLIVCVNLGGLTLTQVADRRREWAIRAALGAAPGRLARQVLRESLGLGLAGGALGIAAAGAGLRALLAAAPAGIPRLDEVHLDPRVLGFGLALSLLAGLLTGLLPALRLGRSHPQRILKEASGTATADHSSLRSRQGLIALQTALSTLLLAAAALLGLSFYRLVHQDVGFQSQHAYAASVTINPYSDAQRQAIVQALPAAAAAVPGVTSAAITSFLPLDGETWVDGVGVPGKTYTAAEQPLTNVRFIGPGYFHAMGTPLLAGRDLAASDRPANWPPADYAAEAKMHEVVVVSVALVRMLWPGLTPQQALGRALQFNGQTRPVIVGVAADARTSLTVATPAVTYQPYWVYPPYRLSLVVRSELPEAALAAPLRAAIWRVAPNAPVPTVKPIADLESEAVAAQRYQLKLLSWFGALALLLAALGVYALVAHSVTRRGKELAIRIALGAPGGNIWKLIVRQAMAPVGAGAILGVAAALGASRALASLLFHTAPTNPMVLSAAAAAVGGAALAACCPPALRATRTDPVAALRSE